MHQSLIASRHSLFTTRYSLPLRLGRNLALPFHSVLRPTPLVPF